MSEEKRRAGFRTRAAELEERFAEVQAMLDTKKADWAKLKDYAAERWLETNKEATKILESGENLDVADSLIAAGFHWTTIAHIARLGLDTTETHDRLAQVENAVEELKFAIK